MLDGRETSAGVHWIKKNVGNDAYIMHAAYTSLGKAELVGWEWRDSGKLVMHVRDYASLDPSALGPHYYPCRARARVRVNLRGKDKFIASELVRQHLDDAPSPCELEVLHVVNGAPAVSKGVHPARRDSGGLMRLPHTAFQGLRGARLLGWGWLDGKLVVHADNDQLVPPAGAERIYPASAVRRDACKVYLPTDLVHQHLAGTLPREVEVLHVLDGHETSAGTHKVERGRRKKNSAYVTPPAYAALQNAELVGWEWREAGGKLAMHARAAAFPPADTSQALFRQALALGADHPDTIATVNNLATCLSAQGKRAEAEPMFRQALAAFTRVLGADHPNTIATVNNLAICLSAQI